MSLIEDLPQQQEGPAPAPSPEPIPEEEPDLNDIIMKDNETKTVNEREQLSE